MLSKMNHVRGMPNISNPIFILWSQFNLTADIMLLEFLKLEYTLLLLVVFEDIDWGAISMAGSGQLIQKSARLITEMAYFL